MAVFMQYDCIIIGSGITGLTAGLYLAKQGKRVLILEKERRVAPVLAGFRKQGLQFDTGLHLTGGLGDGEILHSYLRYLGVDNRVERVPLHAAAAETLVLENDTFTLHMPRGRDRLRDALIASFPGEQTAIDTYFAETLRVVESSPFLNPSQGHDDTYNDFFSEETLETFLARITNNPRLRLVLSLHCALHGTLPDSTRFYSHALVDGSMQQSLYTLRGGGNSLVKALATAFTRLGGQLRVACGAQNILVTDGTIAGVVTEHGETLRASSCIFTAHPALLPGMMPQDTLRPVYSRRLTSLPETMSSCMLFAVINKACTAAANLEGQCVYVCPDRQIAQLFDGQNPEHNLIFFSIPPREKPHKPLTLTAVMSCDKALFDKWQSSHRGERPAAYCHAKTALLSHMKQRIIAKFPFLDGHLHIVEGATPLTLAEYSHNPRGGTYGVMHTVDAIPLLPRTRVNGLFLAGQSILLPGILGCMVSAFVACRQFTGPTLLYEELRQCHENV